MAKVLVLAAFLSILAVVNPSHNQWMTITIRNYTWRTLEIGKSELDSGKWIKVTGFDDASSPTGDTIKPDEQLQISTSGRKAAAVGTEGYFIIKDKDTGLQYGKVKFLLGWSEGKVKVNVVDRDAAHIVDCYPDRLVSFRYPTVTCDEGFRDDPSKTTTTTTTTTPAPSTKPPFESWSAPLNISAIKQ